MDTVAHFLSMHPVALAAAIILGAAVAYAVVKRLAKLALFLLVLALVAWGMLHWLGKL